MTDSIHIPPLPGPFEVTFPDPARGIPALPGSKSLTNRALLLAALAEGDSTLTNVLFADDTRVMMTALQQLGFQLDIDEANLTVQVEGRDGRIPANHAELHLGNAGTAMRFLTAACCLGDPGSEYTLDGVPRMRERPIGELVDALRQLNASVEYLGEQGYPPLRVKGGICGGALTLKPTLSSQFISALLHIGPVLDTPLVLKFEGPVTSLLYVKMTVRMMQRFDESIDPGTYEQITVRHRPYQAQVMTIEPDASNAGYFLAVSALCPNSRCRIRRLGTASAQGDTAFAGVLQRMGAAHDAGANEMYIGGVSNLRGIDIDLNHMPDMAQTLAVVALFAKEPTTIRNVGNLRVKETDRMAALKAELEKLGANVTISGDDIRIEPPPGNRIKPGVAIDTYDDHRMAMAFSIAGLAPGGPGVTINDPSCVNKTFPRFFEYLDRLRG